ncbi:MAG: GNAT family N-acetyltransferase [Anaerolineae bacterium]|nr:GNAT family N-acetyltransferase [Anaerolineae bacterium]
MEISYHTDDNLTPEEYLELQTSLGLGWEKHRSVQRNLEAIRRSAFVGTARHEGLLVGVVRLITDGAYIVHVADICVRKSYQRKGIGKHLLEMAITFARTIGVGTGQSLGEFTLFANTGSVEFYKTSQFMLCPNGMILVDDAVRREFEVASQTEWFRRHEQDD